MFRSHGCGLFSRFATCLTAFSLLAYVALRAPSSSPVQFASPTDPEIRRGANYVPFEWSQQNAYVDPRQNGALDISRQLFTAGVPGEGLLLLETNVDQSNVNGDPGIFAAGIHKPLYPLDRADIVTALLAIIGLMIAAAGGIGGGGILVPLYILCLKFSPKHAVPLSNITIFGGAITNTFLNMKKRHPKADRPLVDWDLILVMEPLTIGGALVGSFIQKILPEFLLTTMMVLLLVVTADRMIRKGIKIYKKETLESKSAKAAATSNGSEPMPSTKNAVVGVSTGDGGLLLTDSSKVLASYGTGGTDTAVGTSQPMEELPGPSDEESVRILSSTASTPPMTDGGSGEEAFVSLTDILAAERDTSAAKVGIMTAVFVVILAVNLLKGGGGFPSPLGIVCGSPSFWAASTLSLAWVLAVSLRIRQHLIRSWRLKEKLGYPYVEGDVEWNPQNTIRYPATCFFAGFFAGMFGVGGGIVKGPLMLEMGVHPMVASATSAVMILYTSFTATTSFVVFGLLRMDYAVPLFLIGLGATAIGQRATDYLVYKFKRPSFIVLSIGSVVSLSAILMGVRGFMDVWSSHGVVAGNAGGICEAGV